MDCTLKIQLLQAIDPMFPDGIHIGPVWIVTQTTRDLLDHIYQTYGKVTPLDLWEKDLSMGKPYNSATPIKNPV